ncbi:MAG: hypothetical protein SH856_03590 [Flavobacteriales bacterium]|nr:hypothetical protein [Flavobacteriales bacterium]
MRIIIILLFTSSLLHAQYVEEEKEEKKESFGQRLVFGGGLGANFSTNYTVLEISPIVGYKLTDRFIPGIGVSYTYLSYYGQSFSIYGYSTWARYLIAENFFAHTEFQQNNFPVFNDFDREAGRAWIPAWLVGGGYHTGRESAVGFSIMILWDLIDDIRSPYQNPIIRGGVMIGF